MELWIQIAIGMTAANIIEEGIFELKSRWYTYKHGNDKKTQSTLDKLLFGTNFENEELLEK